MVEGTVKVVNQLGLHARAAANLVRMAARFESKILLSRFDRELVANAKSILSVLTLAAAIGTELAVTVEGEDESLALAEIASLFATGFGES